VQRQCRPCRWSRRGGPSSAPFAGRRLLRWLPAGLRRLHRLVLGRPVSGTARLARNRPRAVILSCHVLAHYPPSGRPCRLRAMAAVLMTRYGPMRLPPVTASNRSLEIPPCSPRAGRCRMSQLLHQCARRQTVRPEVASVSERRRAAPEVVSSTSKSKRSTFDTAETAPPLPPPAVRIPTRTWKEIERLTRSNVGCGPRGPAKSYSCSLKQV
jgi:hypothetical protein